MRLRISNPWILCVARAVLVALIAAGSTVALACNVPVFRYALDHWRPDAYRALVVSQSALNSEEQKALDQFRERIEKQGGNVEVRAQQRDEHSGGPQLVLLYPAGSGIEQPVWQTSFSEQALNRLSHSPVRQQLIERLVAGQSTVWVLVESSDAVQNQAAAEVLQSQLQSLEKTVELPKLTDDPEDKLVGGPPLRVEFSMLRVARDDEHEQAFVAMLLAAEPDLVTLDEPMVFPVFGCGRAMLPLVGAGITAANIRETAMFLSGACSCQVKEQNPGFDLLTSANWNELMPWTKSLPTNNIDLNAPPELIPIPRGSAALTQPATSSTTSSSELSSTSSEQSLTKQSNVAERAVAESVDTASTSNQPPSSSQLVDKSTIESWLFITGFAIALGAVLILQTRRA